MGDMLQGIRLGKLFFEFFTEDKWGVCIEEFKANQSILQSILAEIQEFEATNFHSCANYIFLNDFSPKKVVTKNDFPYVHFFECHFFRMSVFPNVNFLECST